MTSGATGDTNIGTWSTSSSQTGLKFVKFWNGTDGKYEIFDYGAREKWNSYESHIVSRLISQPKWQGRRNNGDTFTVDSVTIRAILDTGITTFSYPPAEYNRLLEKILNKVKGHDFNLGVNAGQAKELVDMCSSTLNKLGRSILCVKRGDLLGSLKALGVQRPRRGHVRFVADNLFGRWLEIQYGWLPTISDAYEAAKAFEQISNGPRTSRFVVQGRIPIVDSYGSAGALEGRIHGLRGVRLQFELYEEMSFARQLGLLDPLSVAWELTPYSFVVDWFIPIGNYLSDLAQIPYLNGRWLVTEFIRWPKQKQEWVDVPGDPNDPFAYSHGIDYPDIVWEGAGVYRSLNPPTARFPVPRFDSSSLGGNRFANAIALAYQRFLK
jgi:hypothetical protein